MISVYCSTFLLFLGIELVCHSSKFFTLIWVRRKLASPVASFTSKDDGACFEVDVRRLLLSLL